MPTYEYECKACGHGFEVLHGMLDPVLRKCPKCKRLKLQRLISGGAGVIFKGSGFYETDYKRNRSGGAGKAAAKEKDSSSETKPAEPKPESKSETKPKKDSGKKKD